MLEKPDLDDEILMGCLRDAFGVEVAEIAFLPLGNDAGSAVYRVVEVGGKLFFCKLRRAAFDECSVRLPHYLSEQGITQIIAPFPTRTGKLWAELDPFSVILYPFVEGINGYEVELTTAQWADFAVAMKGIHNTRLPPEIMQMVERDHFSPEWRMRCRHLMARVLNEGGPADSEPPESKPVGFDDPIAGEMRKLLGSKAAMILHALDRAEEFAQLMSQRVARHELPFVLCHNDIHPGNLLVQAPTAGGRLFVVDWDYPMLAPKERDLMFIGGGQGFMPYDNEREQSLFYASYGSVEIDAPALAYYRYERGITDIAVDGERILSKTLSDQDRAQSLEILGYYFLPGCPLEMARQVDIA